MLGPALALQTPPIQGYKHIVPKRFSEFQSFSELLKYHFPMARLPKFPSKGGIGGFLTRMDDSTIESRRQNLETYNINKSLIKCNAPRAASNFVSETFTVSGHKASFFLNLHADPWISVSCPR